MLKFDDFVVGLKEETKGVSAILEEAVRSSYVVSMKARRTRKVP